MSSRAEALWSLCSLSNAALFVFAALSATSARADSLPRAIVLRPHSAQSERDAGLNRSVLAALEDLAVVDLLPQPPLDLEAAQLAIDCMEENAHCLREVAQRAQAEVLIAPSVERKAGALELRILYFSAQSGAAPRKVVRQQPGDQLEPETLAAIPDMLRELFGIAKAAATESSAEQAEASPKPTAPTDTSHGKRIPLAPVVLGGAGVLLLATGITLGVVMHDTQRNYAARVIETPAQAAAADKQRKQGESQALIANVMLGVGAAAIVASGIWLALGLRHEQQAQASLLPMLGSDRAGVLLTGSLEARR